MSVPRRRLHGHSPLPDRPILKSHQRFIRSLPCLRCGKPAPSECAYVGMLPGLEILPSERYIVPLCGPATVWQDCCHSRKHFLGAGRFWSELGTDPLDVARQLWLVSGDVTAGLRAVTLVRQGAMAPRQSRSWREAIGSSPRSVPVRHAALNRLPTPMLAPQMSLDRPFLVESG